jgi:hypothetical protein
MSVPVTIQYGTAPTIDQYHRIGKYCYGHINEGFDFKDGNSTGLTWRPGYPAGNFGGEKYYIVSRGNVEGVGGEPTIPTYHVTGKTNAEIVHIINSLHSIKIDGTYYNDVDIAKKYVIENENLNHFLADLSKYKYVDTPNLRLNIDFGNLNCDILETNLAKCYDLIQATDGTIERWFTKNVIGNIPTSIQTAGDNSTYNRRFNAANLYIDLDSSNAASYIAPLNTSSGESFMFALRFIFTPQASNSPAIIYADMGNTRLRYNISANLYEFSMGADTVSMSAQVNTWITLIFGRDNSGQLFIADDGNQGSVPQVGTTEMIFDNVFRLGLTAGGDIRIGSFQYWKGGNYDANKWNEVHNYQMLNKWS